MKVKIATFNVNSIKARLENVLNWLKESNIDIALLQELKCEEDKFPYEAIEDLGYNVAICSQKTYNGVAILSKFKIEDVVKSIPNFDKDLGVKVKKNNDQDLFADSSKKQIQARYIEAVIPISNSAIRVASIYVPNGGGKLEDGQKLENSEKFIYKMNFYDALKNHLKEVLTYDEIAIFGGDYNVGCYNVDVYDPKNLEGTVCFHEDERRKFKSLLNLGLTDSFRAKNPETQAFSWWDYRGNGWEYDKGLRIDYLLTSALATDKITNCYIQDKDVRDKSKASDHCPVVLEIDVD